MSHGCGQVIHRCLTLHISGVASAGGGSARCEEAARFCRLAGPTTVVTASLCGAVRVADRREVEEVAADRREVEEVAGEEEDE